MEREKDGVALLERLEKEARFEKVSEKRESEKWEKWESVWETWLKRGFFFWLVLLLFLLYLLFHFQIFALSLIDRESRNPHLKLCIPTPSSSSPREGRKLNSPHPPFHVRRVTAEDLKELKVSFFNWFWTGCGCGPSQIHNIYKEIFHHQSLWEIYTLAQYRIFLESNLYYFSPKYVLRL